MSIRSKTKIYGSYAAAVLQIIGGVALVLFSGIFQLLSLFLSNAAAGVFAVIFVVLALFLIINGIRGCVLLSQYQDLQKVVEGKERQGLAVLAQTTGKDYNRLVRDLRRMANKGLFPGAWVDLQRKEFVLNKGSRVEGPIPQDATILREMQEKSALPLYGLAATWVIYALALPLYRVQDFIAAAALSAVVFFAMGKFIPKRTVIVEELPQIPAPQKPVAIRTGNPDLDEVLTEASEYMAQLTRLNAAITEVRIDESVEELLNLTRQIVDFLGKNPDKIRQSRQFLGYYLPTTVGLLQNYDELSRERHKGDNIRSAMAKIEETMQSILEAYRRELDNLYRDKAMDITLDIEVMQSIMKEQNLTGSVAELKKNG